VVATTGMANSISRRYRVLVTGGPTRAYLDRVRFLSNFSTGELAFELCRRLHKAGMEVALVSGPCCQPFGDLRLKHWSAVETAEEMHARVLELCRDFKPDYAVFAAAVLDFQPVRVGKAKTRSTGRWTLELKPTPKIIDDVGKKFPAIGRVGFKLEWKAQPPKARDRFARRTMKDKGLQALCLNYLSEISGRRHPAYLYAGDGRPAQATRKSDIAFWITRFLAKDSKARS
jgi:phosphopantothenoylcysteine decarboxylase / phosphopantothenate---cysteine ligase